MHNFDEIVDRKGTYSTQWDYIQDRFGKKDLLPFSISDTDFRTPKEVQEAIAEFNRLGIYGYTRWNHADFKETITAYIKRWTNVSLDPEWIVYSPSVMYTSSILLRELCTKTKKVLTFAPMYDSFYQVVAENGLSIVASQLVNADGYYRIDFTDFAEKAKQVDAFLFCSPHNPTGRLWTEAEIKKLVMICKENEIPIISDEIHMDVNLTQRRHVPILNFYADYSNLYQLSSASKTFNTPGLITSFALIPDEAMRARFLKVQKSRDFLNSASTLGLVATMTALRECDYYVTELCAYIDQNLTYVETFIEENIPEWRYQKSEATYLAWIDCTKMPYSMDELQWALVNIGKVGIMNGKVYGDVHYLRMNCGAPLAKIKQGMEQVLVALEYLRANKRQS